MHRLLLTAALITTSVPLPLHAQDAPINALPASKANDDFESGTLANWRVHIVGEGGWYVYSDGKTPPDKEKSDPFYPFDVQNPPQGKFAVISDTNGYGTRVLYRDVTLDGPYRVTFNVFYVNEGRFSDPDPVGQETLEDRQLYRIDLMSPTAPLLSMDRAHILATIFRGRPVDSARQPPTDLTRDLSQWNGQTIRIRIVSADNEGPLRAGVDNIRFERVSQ